VSPLADRLRSLSDRLARLRGRVRGLYAVDGLSRALLCVLGFVSLTFLADWALDLPVQLRLLLLAGGVGLLAWVLFRRLAIPMTVPLTDDDLALVLERKHPELDDRLVSAIQLGRAPEGPDRSPELVAALVDDAGRAVSSIGDSGVLVGRHVGRIASWALLAGALIAGLAAAFPVHASTYVSRLVGGSAKWPRHTHLRVLDFVDGRRVWARGEDLTVAVEVLKGRPSRCLLDYAFASGEKGTERMSPVGERFQFTFSRLSGPFTFVVRGGDDATSEHRVEVVTPPSIESAKVFLEYPRYTRKPSTPPDQPEAIGNLVAPMHTKVRIEGVAAEDLESVVLKVGRRGKEESQVLPVTPVSDGSPRGFAGGFEITEALGEYSFELKARNGLTNRDPIRFALKGMEDRPPDLVVKDPQGDEFVTDVCARPLELEVRDDWGIARIALETKTVSQMADRAKDWSALEFTRQHNSRDYGEALIRCEAVLDVGKLGLQAGDHVELRFRAEDYKDVGARNVRTSRVYKLSVVSTVQLEKELQDAIEKIKTQLKNQKTREESFWTRTGRLLANYGRGEVLTPEQQGEVRQAGLDQNDVTSKLDSLRKDIRLVQRRGVYNKIFNESAAQKLQGAVDELQALVGEEGRDGVSRLAASRLDQAAKLRTGAERAEAFREAQRQQSAVAAGIQRALEYLDKWSSYQEVIRITRELIDLQKRVNEGIKGVGK
jgi:hypothetical protein